MPLIEAEPKYSVKVSLFVGIPSFILAVAISLLIHQSAHLAAKRYICGSDSGHEIRVVSISPQSMDSVDCAEASLAGISMTFFVALISFGLFIHHPRNLFLASMAFVNATMRLPETIGVFVQMLFHQKTKLIVDESLSLNLMHFKDPTASLVIICFYSLTVIFLTLTIIQDTKMIRWKWLVAIALFISIGPLQHLLWNFMVPLFS